MNHTPIDTAARGRVHTRIIVRCDAADVVAREQTALRRVVTALDHVCGYDGIRRTIVTGGTARRDQHLARSDGKSAVCVVNIVVGIRAMRELCGTRPCPEMRRARIRRDRSGRVDRLRNGGNPITVRKSRCSVRWAHIETARAVHILRRCVICTIGAALVARCDIEVALRDIKAAVDIADVVVRCLARAEHCICDRGLEPRCSGIRRTHCIRCLRDIGNGVAVHQARGRGRGIRAELRRTARVDGGAVLRAVDARLVARTQREVTRRDDKAAVLVGNVVVVDISCAEYGICNFRLEPSRSCVRRDGRTRINRLRNCRDRIAVHKVRPRLNAEQIRPIHIVRGAVRRAVNTALVARGERQRTLLDIKMSVDVGDVIVRCCTRREMRGARLCPKTCCAGVRRNGRRRVDRLRHIVDGIAIDETRRRGSRADVDFARVVHIPRRRVCIAIDARLIARRDGECTLLDRQRAGIGRDMVVRRKAAAARGKRRTVQGHRVSADTRALGDIIRAVRRRDRILGEAVARKERACMRRTRRHGHAVVRRAVNALAARRCEVDVDGLDRELAGDVLKGIVARREIAARKANRVLARMNRALRIACRLCRVRNRGIGNSPREQSRRRRCLTVREVCERDTVRACVVVRIAVVGHRLRLARNRDDARHDAIVDRDLVVEVVMSLIGDLLIGNRRIRAVGTCTRTHIDIGQSIRHCAVCRIDVGIDVRMLRRAKIVRARILHMVADIVDLRLVERTALEVAIVFDMEARR